MNYKITTEADNLPYIHIEFTLQMGAKSQIIVDLPAWRPGRYEIQNFAKYIREVKAFDKNHKALSIKKVKKDSWKVFAKKDQTITISYQFYADFQNAGGSLVDKTFFYINPVTALMYVKEQINEPCTLQITYPENEQVACGLTFKRLNKNTIIFQAANFHDLVDSPLMMSNAMQHKTYQVQNIPFHIWVKGAIEIPWERVLTDFKKFTEAQINIFGEFPEKDYHFMLWVTPQASYHGVEHRNSTMMTLGPDSQSFEEFYPDLLGLASHELFHAWNVKKIRPKELMPYDYSTENYFDTCFIAEGVTTLYGDWINYRSGVIDKSMFIKEMDSNIKRHFNTTKLATESLLQSSYDLWLDGYEKGAPGRKVSVYNKGALVALILHVQIQQSTQKEKGLDDVMRLMWERFGKPYVGYSLDDYKTIVEEVTGKKMNHYFKKMIAGSESILEETAAAMLYLDLKVNLSNDGTITLVNLAEN